MANIQFRQEERHIFEGLHRNDNEGLPKTFLEQCAGLHASVVPQVRRNPDQLHCVTRLHVCILWQTPHNYCNQAVALRTRPMSVMAIFRQPSNSCHPRLDKSNRSNLTVESQSLALPTSLLTAFSISSRRRFKVGLSSSLYF